MKEQSYRRAWRSFYLHFATLIVVFVLAIWASFKTPLQPNHQKWLWVAFLIFAVLTFLYIGVKRLQESLIVRENEIALSKGIFSHDSTEIGVQSIRTIQVRQSLVQRMLDVGDILVASSGTDGYEISFCNILHPHQVRDSMQTYERVTPSEAPAGAPNKTDAQV